jgi:hypothetical protein
MTIETTQRSMATMRRTTAFTGLAAFALLAIGQGLIQVGGAEPPFDAPASDIVPFFVARDAELFFVGTYLRSSVSSRCCGSSVVCTRF